MRRLISILAMMTVSLFVVAQKELGINEVFEWKSPNITDRTETRIQGNSLEVYRLDVLRTLKFVTHEEQRNEVEHLFKVDMKEIEPGANDNMEYETRDGHIYYAVVQLTDYMKRHRYICYQCKPDDNGYRITLAYMRGKATMKELRKMFKK